MRYDLSTIIVSISGAKSIMPPRDLFRCSSNVDVIPVSKIGGSCIKTPEDFERVLALLVDAHSHNAKIVFSAASGVTNICDELFQCFSRPRNLSIFEKKFKELSILHLPFAKVGNITQSFKLWFDSLKREVKEVLFHNNFENEESVEGLYPYISSMGERIMEYLIVESLKNRGISYEVIDPTKVIHLFRKDSENHHGFQSRLNLNCSLEGLTCVLKRFQNKAVLMRGYQVKNGTLGKNGSDTSLALLASACLIAFDKEVAVRLYKRDKVTSTRRKGNVVVVTGGMKYSTLASQQKSHEQPFIHQDSLEILSHFSIPVKIESWEDSEYDLVIVSNRKHIEYYSKVKKEVPI